MSITTRTPPPSDSRWAQAEAIKKQKQGRTRRKVFYWTAAIIALALLGIGIWELMGTYKAHKHQQLLDALKADPTQIKAAVDSHQITDREGWRIRGETFREVMEKQMDGYFALKSPAERQAWMKDWINDEPQRRADMHKQWAASGATSRPWNNAQTQPSNEPSAQEQANRAAQRIARYESRDPNRAAQMHQFFSAMLGEMKLMGMPAPQFGRHH